MANTKIIPVKVFRTEVCYLAIVDMNQGTEARSQNSELRSNNFYSLP